MIMYIPLRNSTHDFEERLIERTLPVVLNALIFDRLFDNYYRLNKKIALLVGLEVEDGMNVEGNCLSNVNSMKN